jgi:hypothetical protein
MMTMRDDEMDAGAAVSSARDGATKGTAMTPSQHLRTTLGRTRTSRLAFATTLLLGATLALSACGAVQEAGAAAIVNGTAISDQDLQTVSNQLKSITPDGRQSTLGSVLVDLIVARFVLAEADRAHKTISDADARKPFPTLANPAPPTMKLFRMQGVLAQLDQASRDSIGKEILKAKITINPRYGTFDAAQGVVPSSPNWIKPSAASPAK